MYSSHMVEVCLDAVSYVCAVSHRRRLISTFRMGKAIQAPCTLIN